MTLSDFTVTARTIGGLWKLIATVGLLAYLLGDLYERHIEAVAVRLEVSTLKVDMAQFRGEFYTGLTMGISNADKAQKKPKSRKIEY